jgi:sarcosine oxidase, subunit gamma
MSDLATSALPGAEFSGFVQVREAGLQGMITLRGDLASGAVAAALQTATGCALPAQRKVTRAEGYALAWMSPDEVLLLCPYAQAPALVATLAQALAGEFATVANVSDARAVFTLSGPGWRDALAKLCPVDFGALAEGEIRRTRAAQVAAAIWVSGPQEVHLVCFRSVAGYMFDLLSTASAPGSEPGLYA